MEECIFDKVFGSLFRSAVRHRPQGANRRVCIDELISKYHHELDSRDFSPDQVRNELCAIFRRVRAECEAYGRGKRHIQMNILRILNALDQGIKAKRGEYLLAKWKRLGGYVES